MLLKNAIASLDFFDKLSELQIEELIEISSLKSYSEDSILFYERNETNKIFFLVNGLAKAYKIDKYENEIFLYYINQNTLLSEITNIYSDNLEFFSNISFVSESMILSIDYKKFKEIFLLNNILNLEFINEIILKSQKIQSLINREFIFDAVAKVTMLLSSDLVMFNKLKRHEISLMLHIQPSTLSRVLNRLKRDSIIDIEHGKISILNKAMLDIIHEEI